MLVQKRGNRGFEKVSFDKITLRLQNLAMWGTPLRNVNVGVLSQKTIAAMYDRIPTEQLDRIAANIADSMRKLNPEYGIMSSRILVSNLHKNTIGVFSECMEFVQSKLDLLNHVHLQFIRDNAAALDAMIVHDRDYLFEYRGMRILEKQYLFAWLQGTGVFRDMSGDVSVDTTIARKEDMVRVACDRMQYMYMRVAIEMNVPRVGSAPSDALARIKAYYDKLSTQQFIHATPTLFNSCTKLGQLNSCFILSTNDSTEDIMKTVTNTALISRASGGIGVSMHEIRGRGALIKGTNGLSCGVVPQLRIYNDNMLCWNQGGDKRPGSMAVYFEPWHRDFMAIMRLTLPQGAESERCRDLFPAVWMPDLFMRRWLSKGKWSLFSADTAPGLNRVYDGMMVCTVCAWSKNRDYRELIRRGIITAGDECGACVYAAKNVFTELYERYEHEARAYQVLPAETVINAICASMRESGLPYMTFKDNANTQSNQQNLGTIQGSNLCTEIMEVHRSDSYACCALSSVNVKKFWRDGTYDFDALHECVVGIAAGLDQSIANNKYPVKECEPNAYSWRPIGIGVQGLANLFMLMRIPYLSDEAAQMDLAIFETIYHAALTSSMQRAVTHGAYEGWRDSPAASGILRQDLFAQRAAATGFKPTPYTPRWDWDTLRSGIMKNGLRNSLHIAPMPTASTGKILGNVEAIEPLSSNLYVDSLLGGKITVQCDLMVNHLIELGLWSEDMYMKVKDGGGSIAKIESIPESVRAIYRTVWEMSQKDLILRAANRQRFIDQAQSLNIHLTENTDKILKGVIKTGWESMLPTGSYYIRTQAAGEAMRNDTASVSTHASTQPTLTSSLDGANKSTMKWGVVSQGGDTCESCGS